MGLLLAGIPGPVLLLWMADRAPQAQRRAIVPWGADAGGCGDDGPGAAWAQGVEVAVSPAARRQRRVEGMVFPPMAEPAARGLPGVAAHEEVAGAFARLAGADVKRGAGDPAPLCAVCRGIRAFRSFPARR
jgi:hypothetical protein